MRNEIDRAIVRIQNGDQEGLASLYDLTSRAVFAFILPVINDYQLAEDIMQETYVSAYRAIGSYEPGTSGLNWLFTIARNHAYNVIKKRQHDEPVDFDAQHERAGSILERPNWETPTIDIAKKILPPDEQNILFLYTIGEYKHREIAELLNLPLGTVTWKYQVAIKKMQQYLKEGADQ